MLGTGVGMNEEGGLQSKSKSRQDKLFERVQSSTSLEGKQEKGYHKARLENLSITAADNTWIRISTSTRPFGLRYPLDR